MKKYLLSLLLLLPVLSNAFVVDQGNIDLSSVTASRTSGVAPLSVFFDGSGITDVGVTSNPYLDLDCNWDFGEPTSGNWGTASTGSSGTGLHLSKNLAHGLTVAHVYETPGTYTANVSCTDGTNRTAYKKLTITVSDPDGVGSAFITPATNTYCIFNVGDTLGTGCPINSTQIQTDSLNTALASQGPNKRFLFKSGGTWSGTNVMITTGPMIISKYGSGAKPIFTKSGSLVAAEAILRTDEPINTSATIGGNDVRIVDIELTGPCSATCGVIGAKIGGQNMTLLRVNAHDLGNSISLPGSTHEAVNLDTRGGGNGGVSLSSAILVNDTTIPLSGLTANSHTIVPGSRLAVGGTTGGGSAGTVLTVTPSPPSVTIDTPVFKGFAISTLVQFWDMPLNPTYPLSRGITIVDSNLTSLWAGSGGIHLYITAENAFIGGNFLSDSTRGEHIFRSQGIDKGFITHNVFENPAATKHVFTLRGLSYQGNVTYDQGRYSQYVNIVNNKFIGSNSTSVANPVNTEAQNSNNDERIRYVVFDRNLFVAGDTTTQMLNMYQTSYSKVSNNVFILTKASGVPIAVLLGDQQPGALSRNTTSHNVHIYNNTFYTAGSTGSNWYAIVLDATNTNPAHDIYVKNNLVYAPNIGAGPNRKAVSGCGSCVPLTASSNTSDANIISANPNFTNPSANTMHGFSLTCTGSTYPCGQGELVPVWYDSLLRYQPATRDLGAIVH